MMLTRRQLLRLGLCAVAGAGLGSWGHRRRWGWDGVYRQRRLNEHLHRTFGYLRPDPAGVDRFVALYLEHHNGSPTRGSLPHVEQTFLLSTDFFQSGQPATGPIRFVTLYHPYVSPCYDPLVATA